MKRPPLLALPFVVLALAGCGSNSTSNSAPGGAPGVSGTSSSGGEVHATIKNFAFIPNTIHVSVGQTIEWTNEDAAPHNVIYVSGPELPSSGTLNTGATFSIKATRAGTTHYYCSIHPWMTGTIVVSP